MVPGPGSLGRLTYQAEVAADVELGAVGQVDVAADVQEVQVAADVDAGSRQVDSVEHVERVHVAAGRDRCTGQNCVEGDPVDGRGAADDERPGEDGVLEALDVADLAGVDRDLADIEDVSAGRCRRRSSWRTPSLVLTQWIDRQLGILG